MEGDLPVPSALFGGGELFALHVLGNSMTGAGIINGDIAVIKRVDKVENREIAAVLVKQEATLKQVYISSNTLVLKSKNPAFTNLTFDLGKRIFVRIFGRYQGIIMAMDNRCYS